MLFFSSLVRSAGEVPSSYEGGGVMHYATALS